MAMIPKEEASITEQWRNVFLTSPDGKEVLSELMSRMHTFESIHEDNPAEVSLRNFGVWIFYRLGMYQDMNIGAIIDKMAEMPYKEI